MFGGFQQWVGPQDQQRKQQRPRSFGGKWISSDPYPSRTDDSGARDVRQRFLSMTTSRPRACRKDSTTSVVQDTKDEEASEEVAVSPVSPAVPQETAVLQEADMPDMTGFGFLASVETCNSNACMLGDNSTARTVDLTNSIACTERTQVFYQNEEVSSANGAVCKALVEPTGGRSAEGAEAPTGIFDWQAPCRSCCKETTSKA